MISLRRAGMALVILVALVVLVPWAAPDWSIHSIDDLSVDRAFVIAMPAMFLNGAQYGPDVIFTYGPLGFLISNAVPFRLLPAVLAFRILLVVLPLVYVLRHLHLMPVRLSGRVVLVAGAFVLWAYWSTIFDQGLWMLPALLVATDLLSHETPRRDAFDRCLLVALTVVAAVSGLVKFNLLVSAMVVALAILACDLRRWRFPTLPFVWLVATVAAWLAAGQSLANLPLWIVRSLDLAAGYADAMSKGFSQPYGLPVLAAFYLGLAGVVVTAGVVALGSAIAWDAAFLLFAVFASVAYFAMQHAIGGNQLEQATGEALGGAWLLAWSTARGVSSGRLRLTASLLIAVSVVSLGAGLVGSLFWPYSRHEVPERITANIAAIGSLIRGDVSAQRLFWRRLMADTARTIPLPPDLHGTADIYPQHTAAVIADPALRYTPRPAYLSLNAHTFSLAQANAAALQQHGPDTVLFQILDPARSVNQRLPATDDGPSWPELLSHYRLDRIAGEFLVLLRRPAPLPRTRTLVLERDIGWGETVALPAGRMLWAAVDVERSAVGHVVQLVYKPPHVQITLRHATASSSYQLVPGLGRAGFLVSPLVTTTFAFAGLFRPDDADAPPVSAFSLKTEPGTAWFWSPRIHVRIYQLSVATQPEPEDAADDELRLRMLQQRAVSCLFPPTFQPAPGESRPVLLVHAPCHTSIPVPSDVVGARVHFGLRYLPDPHEPARTDGAELRFSAIDPQGTRIAAASRFLDPVAQPGDRGPQEATLRWAPGSTSRIQIDTDPGPRNDPIYDHTYISSIEFLRRDAAQGESH